MSDRAEFLANVSRNLGRSRIERPKPPESTALSLTNEDAIVEAERVRAVMAERSGELLSEFAVAAEAAGWVIHRAATVDDAAEAVSGICVEAGIGTALRSAHPVLEHAEIDLALRAAGVEINLMRYAGATRDMRDAVFTVDVGITGCDYAVAETGTVVLHPRAGVSRLVSLAPPRHIAVVECGTVLPSLDELFALERADAISGNLAGSMNLISGPSRTGDIEATIVKGIHGPVEVHAVLIG